MNRLKKIFLGACMVAFALQIHAQLNGLPVVNVDGKNYYSYEVKPKETVYSLSKRFGITAEDLIKHNPSVADGLKAGQMLYFPADESTAAAVAGVHVVKKGETIYGISRQYGMTVDQLMALNPAIRDGIRPGDRIRLSAPAADEAPATPVRAAQPSAAQTREESKTADETATSVRTPATVTYQVKKNETFYSIAHSYNLTVEDLENANPGIALLREGMILVIPVEGAQQSAQEMASTPATPVITPDTFGGRPAENTVPVTAETPAAPAVENKSIDIAVMLPFMLHEETQPRQAQLYTEFYKGFLLAVDSLRTSGRPINIRAYDTAASIDTVRSILHNPAMAGMDVILAPDDEAHLVEIADFGRRNNVTVLNLFAVKDQSQLTNPVVMQGNIPHDEMYEKAIKGMTGRFARFSPVIVRRKDAMADKDEFIVELKKNLDAKAISYQEIEFDGILRLSDLESLDPEGAYAFIPVTARQAELNKIIPGLLAFKEQSPSYDSIRLFGYPEWTTFRGETLDNMHKLNTLVYSRFYIVPDDPAVKDVEERFQGWYGVPMGNYVPRQGLFGFDAGMYLIKALLFNGGDFSRPTPMYRGVQNGFEFIRPEGSAGYVNDELYFINFRPSGLIDKISL